MHKLANWFTVLPRLYKQGIMAVADVAMLLLALWSAFAMRLGELYQPSTGIGLLILVAPIIAIPIFIRFGLYRAIVRYIGFRALWAVVQAVTLYALLWGVLEVLSGVKVIPRSVILINWVIAILLVGGSRMIARWWFSGSIAGAGGVRRNVVIYGAGSAGVQLASALTIGREFKPVAYLDDDARLHGRHINGLAVLPFTRLGQLIANDQVEEILLALPSVSRSRRNEIITLLEPYPVHVRTLPGVSELAQGNIRIDDVREVTIEDLLGRDQVAPNEDLLHRNIAGKIVMVTGAGGSIGSELCRQILALEPAQLLLFEQSEYALYAIERELIIQINNQPAVKNAMQLVPVLGSVLDSDRLRQVIQAYGVQTIYHTAAYKHVPMVEKNPAEAIRNNILGTWRSAQVAGECGVEAFVLISTDKAVRPTNTMGATKRVAELVLQGLSLDFHSRGERGKGSETRYCMVRFGNVLGSSGSVVPLFREQIRKGGPVTVTDPKIIRYFMTIPEAAQLVIQAGAMGQGGDVFVLDMGEPVRILDLARKMIHLSGFDVKDEDHPKGDIEIIFTGLRSGEKLYEELLIGDNVQPTDHPLIMRAEEYVMPWPEIEALLNNFESAAADHDQERIRELLLEAVAGFKPQCGIEDSVYRLGEESQPDNVHRLPLQN